MTKQSEAEACDINGIMKRYENDGILNHLMKHEGRFGDFIDAQEYHEAMTAVVLAQEMFEDLPAAVRERFANDPASFLQFAQDPANASELVKMGLATERPVETAPGPPQEPKEPEAAPQAPPATKPPPAPEGG